MKNKQRSFLLISVVILVFIAFLFRNSLVQRSEQRVLLSSLKELEGNSRQISKLDTITMSLQTAENNFRMYTTLWDTVYFKRYTKEVLLISGLLQDLMVEDSSRIPGHIVGDLKSKKGQMMLYGEIKKLTDSLNNVNVELELLKITGDVPKLRPSPKATLKKTTRVEQLKASQEVKKEKFFKRLKNAILNKEEHKDSVKTLKTEVTYEQGPSNVDEYNNKQ
jgi:uncharacterized membrane protein